MENKTLADKLAQAKALGARLPRPVLILSYDHFSNYWKVRSMTFGKSYILAVALVVSPLATLAQGAWQGIPFGSSASQILKIGDKLDITPVDPPQDASTGVKKYVPLQIKNFKVGSTFYTVKFRMLQTTSLLNEVQLTAKNGGSNFSQVDLALTEKYGQPLFRKKDELQRMHVWNTKDARISLRHLTFMGVMDDISITYESTAAAGDSNL